MTAAAQSQKHAVLASARNEGLWLLEWVAYHRAIGFDLVFVATNDCTDGSDAMMARLAEMGQIIHLPHTPPPDVPPQVAGCDLALAHPAMTGVDWLLHIDIDEFLNVTCGSGHIDDLLAVAGHGADCISLTWKMFGSDGRRLWSGGSVLEIFARTEDHIRRRRLPLGKCLFRPDQFGQVVAHVPKSPRRKDVSLVNSRGEALPTDALFSRKIMRHTTAAPRLFTWDNAAINHYAIRSEDILLLKNHRRDGLGMSHTKYFKGSDFWVNADRNEATDTTIQRHLPATKALLAEWRTDPEVARLEQQAFDAFVRLRQELLLDQGLYGWDAPIPQESAAP
ncbi:glycosyltransferase family 2 protein [Fuscibacter oryzae]|uniref:Glycosyltransferase family 2 protein n=1 Tax=Fuscibacter oryzae TaxID=2803939 RepID=A0A8J7MWA2_9RHOB|nr:glycosyltransferase family 2 protein [Fuscibacter oryzae]MBL4929798.1 glycosyltransferase family 2 protein [Fuscibacter oryzae]